jgi:hypothetical protein
LTDATFDRWADEDDDASGRSDASGSDGDSSSERSHTPSQAEAVAGAADREEVDDDGARERITPSEEAEMRGADLVGIGVRAAELPDGTERCADIDCNGVDGRAAREEDSAAAARAAAVAGAVGVAVVGVPPVDDADDAADGRSASAAEHAAAPADAVASRLQETAPHAASESESESEDGSVRGDGPVKAALGRAPRASATTAPAVPPPPKATAHRYRTEPLAHEKALLVTINPYPNINPYPFIGHNPYP